jgi:REP element-mobilizing transposase RayT
MPNHLHGIIIIFDKDTVGAIHELPLLDKQKIKDNYRKLRRSMLLPKIIGYFKMNTAKSINKSLDTNYKLWQRNYYEHIIRDERDFYNTRQYIFYNPLKWAWDKENPNRIK